MKTQKDAVVEAVFLCLPTFQKYKDNAILLLSHAQLESIKLSIANDITSGVITYGKDHTNLAEVRSYARSMVMNHLKKAKELNGGHVYQSNVSGQPSTRVKAKVGPKGVNVDLLPDDLKEWTLSSL